MRIVSVMSPARQTLGWRTCSASTRKNSSARALPAPRPTLTACGSSYCPRRPRTPPPTIDLPRNANRGDVVVGTHTDGNLAAEPQSAQAFGLGRNRGLPYGWDRTRIDSTEGARIWTGHGVLAHNLVKISALAP